MIMFIRFQSQTNRHRITIRSDQSTLTAFMIHPEGGENIHTIISQTPSVIEYVCVCVCISAHTLFVCTVFFLFFFENFLHEYFWDLQMTDIQQKMRDTKVLMSQTTFFPQNTEFWLSGGNKKSKNTYKRKEINK